MATVNNFQFQAFNIPSLNVTETHMFGFCRYQIVFQQNIRFYVRVCHCGNYCNKETLIKKGLNMFDIGDGVEVHISPLCTYLRMYNKSTKTFTLTRVCYCPKQNFICVSIISSL